MTPRGIAKREWRLDTAVLFLLATVLVWPLFRLKYLDNWTSIEATFIADGRMLRENWLHHLWQPLWYCGTRAGYVYPPGLSVAVAALSALTHITPAHAYHVSIATLYALGIVAVYWWTRAASGSRRSAWLAALGVALVSPCIWLLPDFRIDTPLRVPWRMHVLMTYGEGPHISSLAVLPIVWLGAWRRFHGGGVRWLLLSSVAAAIVVTINFYGATALAITFALLVWACFLERRDWRIFRDGVITAALAYGLTAWWLVPSYFSITSGNLRLVAPAGNRWSTPVLVALLIVYVALSLRARWGAYPCFIGSSLGFLTLYVLGYRWIGFQVAGNSLRLAPELDLFAILCGVALAERIWRARARISRIGVAAVVAICFVPSWSYISHAYAEFPRNREWRHRIEYRTPAWLEENFPGQRVFVTGTLRFWYNVWRDGQQADGGSDQGILNPLLPAAKWRIIHESNPAIVQDWLQALGVDIVVVPGPTSREGFKEYVHPEIFDGYLPLLRDDREGNRYYRVPRRATGIVRLVDRSLTHAVPPLPSEPEAAQFHRYAASVEAPPPGGDAPSRASGRWQNSDALDIAVELRPGESLLVEETYDPYWRASVDGRAQIITRDAAGFMLLDAPPGKHSVSFVFQTPDEAIVGRALTLVSLWMAGWLFYAGRWGLGRAE